MKKYGLIGYPLGHSFSKKYFTEKFLKERINAAYENYPIEAISEFPKLLRSQPALCGLNVTIPYKEEIIPYLDELDETAKEVGAVNTIQISRQGKKIHTKGFNTDVFGFEKMIAPELNPGHNSALILGTGGASKAVAYVLKKLGIDFTFVSRYSQTDIFSYADLSSEIVKNSHVIINTTPLGMFPHVDGLPNLDYSALTPEHLLVDLIYNPEETLFLKKGKAQGATSLNGLKMLRYQAEKAWEIFA
ncbi:MAG: shikimate dehydrogenase [Bacteroidales bacterium]|nr:shikimate dehydrogenase [Bacteroidales bacterium]MCF8456332.1 shikimate dehydrogenase [Bacteroidales bacterium]